MRFRWLRPRYGVHGVDGDILFYTERARDRWIETSDAFMRVVRAPAGLVTLRSSAGKDPGQPY